MGIRYLAAAAGLAAAATATADPAGSPDAVREAMAWSEPAVLAPSSLVLDAEVLPGRLVVVGERGHILFSEDGGEHWTQAEVPTRSLLTAVAGVGASTLWAVGHDAVILHSPDGGSTWERRHWAPDWEQPLFDVWFRDEQFGLAVGAYGLLLETRDGGAVWTRRILDEDEPHVYFLAPAGGGRLYAAGEFGTVFRSDDDGESWERCDVPYGGTFFGALALRDGAVLAFGLRGTVYRSPDGGETWTAIETGVEAGLFHGLETRDGRVVLVGQGGRLLQSFDGGASFHAGSIGNRDAISSIAQCGDDRFLLVGEGGIRFLDGLPRPRAAPPAAGAAP